MKKLLLLLATAAALAALAAPSSPARTMHGCHNYCAWVWLGYGSGAWCGSDHNGDIVHDLATGEGYRCTWMVWNGAHDGWWTSGYGRVKLAGGRHG